MDDQTKTDTEEIKETEIDFFAASQKRPVGRPPKPKPATSKPKRPPGRPKSLISKDKPAKTQTPSNLYNIYNKGNGINREILDTYDTKSKMTPQELKFLEYHLVMQFRIIKAMSMSGYKVGTNTYKYLLAKKILQKYEEQADDHRKIFRAVGLGEIAVAKGILKACQKARTTKELTDAYGLAAKCLGLQREVIEGAGGITLIITGQGEESGEIKEPGTLAEPQKRLPAPAMIRD
jgi:hypothetical protein